MRVTRSVVIASIQEVPDEYISAGRAPNGYILSRTRGTRQRGHVIQERTAPHALRRWSDLRLPRARPEGWHPGDFLRPPGRNAGQLGPAHHRPHREEPPRHRL